jgi:hypothetical protein
MSDRSEYTDTGFRGKDGREGFGDDMGTRVGRPDGAHEAPRDAGSGGNRPGQPGTNADAVDGGIEGSIMDDEGNGEGDEQSRVRGASRAGMDPDPEAGDERPSYNL